MAIPSFLKPILGPAVEKVLDLIPNKNEGALEASAAQTRVNEREAAPGHRLDLRRRAGVELHRPANPDVDRISFGPRSFRRSETGHGGAHDDPARNAGAGRPADLREIQGRGRKGPPGKAAGALLKAFRPLQWRR